jgi:hypothetical protein
LSQSTPDSGLPKRNLCDCHLEEAQARSSFKSRKFQFPDSGLHEVEDSVLLPDHGSRFNMPMELLIQLSARIVTGFEEQRAEGANGSERGVRSDLVALLQT